MVWLALVAVVGLCCGAGVALYARNLKKNARNAWLVVSTGCWVLAPVLLFGLLVLSPGGDGVVAATVMSIGLVAFLVLALATLILGSCFALIERQTDTFACSRLLALDYGMLIFCMILVSKLLLSPIHRHELTAEIQLRREREMEIADLRSRIPEPYQAVPPDTMRRGQGFSPEIIRLAEEVNAKSKKLSSDRSAVYDLDRQRRRWSDCGLVIGWLVASVFAAIRGRHSASCSLAEHPYSEPRA
jgi:hypothetical protein